MSDKLTRIGLPGCPNGWGIMDWGEHDAAEMVRQIRARAAHLRQQVEAIEAADDQDFKIDVVRGSVVQHHLRSIQTGRTPHTPSEVQ